MEIITRKSLLFMIISIMVLAKCAGPKEEAVVDTEAQKEAEILKNALWSEVDTSNSVITWIGSQPSGQHNGIIPISAGSLAFIENEIIAGEFEINIRGIKIMDLLDEPEKNKELRDRLLSDVFFDADSFPNAFFKITSVIPYDSSFLSVDTLEIDSVKQPATLSEFMVKDPTHWIESNLTIKGITKNISFPGSIKHLTSEIRAEAKFNLDRTDWNISYKEESSVLEKAKDQFIYSTVNVGLHLEARLPTDTTNQEKKQDLTKIK